MALKKNNAPHSDIIRVTKQFRFEMAHALYGYDGPCRNIHGHSYTLDVTLAGPPLNQSGHPKDGLVIDFGDIKQTVQSAVIIHFDHALALSGMYAEDTFTALKSEFDKVLLLPFQPSCENLLIEIKNRLQDAFDTKYKLFSVKLHETQTSFAEWYLSDNT